jgi:hypothetical protein
MRRLLRLRDRRPGRSRWLLGGRRRHVRLLLLPRAWREGRRMLCRRGLNMWLLLRLLLLRGRRRR